MEWRAGARTPHGPDAGVTRGEWQWRGHGPTSARGYAWEYRGGFGRSPVLGRTEAGAGPRDTMQWRLAEERAGGLPRERERYNPDRWFSHLGEGRYDRGFGYDRGFRRRR